MEFSALSQAIKKTGVLSFDLETTSLDPKEAEILLIAMSSGKGNGMKTVVVSPTVEAREFLVKHLLDPEIRVVGHNHISYDLEVLHYRGIIGYDDVKAKLIDTLLLSWLYNENIPHDLKSMVWRMFKYKMVTFSEAFLESPSLNAIRALRKEINEIQKTKIDKIGALFRKRKSRDKKALEAELKSTFEGRRKRVDQIEKKKMRAKIARHLDLRYGPEAIEQTKKLLHEEEITPKLEKISDLEIRAEQEKVEYARDDAKQDLRLYYRLRRTLIADGLSDWAEVMMDVRRVAARAEMNGILINSDEVDRLDAEFQEIIEEFRARVFNTARMEFNINSPDQVKHVLYDVLQITPITDVDKDGNTVEIKNTAEKTLTRLNHRIAQEILDFKAIHKLWSTYVHKIKLVLESQEDPEARLYGHFNTTGTVTGRWSSSGPNLQNIPSRSKPAQYDERIQNLGPLIRKIFIAPPGKKLVCADLSQIELRLVAHLTNDMNLMTVYSETVEYDGITYYTGDIHRSTSEKMDVPRKLAKNLNFGLIYGQYPKAFAKFARLFIEAEDGTKTLDIASAAKHRNNFFRTYPGLEEYIENLEESREASEGRYCQTKFQTLCGRYRHFPHDEWATGGKILNSIIQGGASDILNVIVWAIDKFILKNPYFKGARLILQVHDEVCLEVPEAMAEEVGIVLKYIMECPWFDLSVPVLAAAKICDNWGDNNDDDVPEIGVVPPPESGIKAAVAMLTKEQRKWASQFVEVKNFSPRVDGARFIKV